MEVKASLKHLRIAPRKTRLVASLIRGLEVEKAINQLRFLNKKSAKPTLKLLESAIANAVNNYSLDRANLVIKEIKVDEGRVLKRWLPRAHGRATILRNKFSHITIVLSEIVDSGKKEAKKVEVEAPVKLDEMAKEAKSTKKDEGKGVSKKESAKAKASSENFSSKVFRRKAG